MGRNSSTRTTLKLHNEPSKLAKYSKYFSTHSLKDCIQKKQKAIRSNFKVLIQNLMKKEQTKRQNCLVSFLNIMNPQDECFQSRNLQGIPSIQNMISQPYIKSTDQHSQDNLSYFDINSPFKSSLLISDPHLPIFYICLLQKILKKINCPLSKRQNKQIIKGTWNIMIKFWKDYDYEIYRVNKNIEWGLLQLINFQFYPKKKQRFQAEQILRKHYNFNQITIYKQKIQKSQPFCTLQHIQ